MNDLNVVVISGRLTKNPEFIDKGSFQIAKFSVAINYNYKKEGEWQTETTYVDCVAWNQLAEIVNRIAKRGAFVTVEARIVQEHWVNAENKNRSKLTFRCIKFNKISDSPIKAQPTEGSEESTIPADVQPELPPVAVQPEQADAPPIPTEPAIF